MMDREYERTLMLMHPDWINDGAVRRDARQLMRKWARKGTAYGRSSTLNYCEYVVNHPERVGGIK
jgi:hypothetical protein